MKIFSATHRGLVRKINEDRFLAKEYADGVALLAVADGLGGHEGGERAAQMAISTMENLDTHSPDIERDLVQLVRTANRDISEASARNPTLKKMGTTLTAALVRDGAAHWVHVGDSRLYLFREEILLQITEDHTPLGILVRGGEITKEEARRHPLHNLLISCLGREKYEVDSGTLKLGTADLLLFTTDGLHDGIPEEKFISLLKANVSLEAKLDDLVEAALTAGGRDNITVVAVEI
ncbi:PP2C family serine/threonine-protein phosphatase [Desulforhabdus sp. TSK]|uniref:PP2C family protein-serine/threonine phosphatase n=1 Tax=Desulforhabdus sp. TSK TaxID=2925014 RepID=UPI001FC8D497|nr:protein phosphatase 2C domain-containing protein [Desulforhabdus sp. TSK]GKT09763.1 protein-serine/threonine phosphatase [Desulforhabdus sp. TSK]